MKSQLKSLYRYACNLIDNPVIILLYHRVKDLPLDPQELSVSSRNFTEHIKFLKENYHILDIAEFSHLITQSKPFPDKSVVITFDDGYADNLQEAIPILEAHQAQALFYITTSTLGTSLEFWWDDLERVFLHHHTLPPKLQFTARNQTYTFSTANKKSQTKAYQALHPIIKECKSPQRDQVMEHIISWSGLSRAGRESHRPLTYMELKQLSESPSAVIGAHTHTHPKLSVLSEEEQRKDIQLSKEILEDKLNKQISHFSYPFGSSLDYNKESVKVCKQLGFSLVCGNYYNQVHRWSNPFALPRMLVRDWPIEVFRLKLDSFSKY